MVSEQTSNDLFNKIRSKFGNVHIGDSQGQSTSDPNDAVFFDFEFKEDADTFGRISISLADGETVKVFYSRDLVEKIDEDSKSDWYLFLKELKDFAVEHSLGFDVRDITKSNLTQQDFKNLADTNKTVNTDGMSEELSRITKLAGLETVAEGLTGTATRSFENLDKTRLIIRHKGKVDETVPGARSRQIQSLYIENEDGERFKYPIIHLAGARAMTRHVANGGKPYDDFGKHIVATSEDIAKLNSFTRYVANKDQLNDSAGDIIDQTKLKLENLRSYMKNLSKQSHYETASKDFKTAEQQILDDETANQYREKFTLKNLDSRVEEALPLIHSVMKEFDDKPLSQKDIEIPPPVDGGAVVQQFLANPDKQLVLNKDKGELSSREMKFTQDQRGKNQMFATILSDIAERLLVKDPKDDIVANFASDIADQIGNEGTPFFKPDKNYIKNKKIAYQLAKRYADDVKRMKQDPEFADEIRKSPSEFAPKKDRMGKAKESELAKFENWANRLEARINEGTWALPNQDSAGADFKELEAAMSKDMPVGTDAMNATGILSDLGFGDDELYDDLGRLYDEKGPDADGRELVHDYVLNKILKSSRVNDYYTPEEQENLKNAVHSNADKFAKNKEDNPMRGTSGDIDAFNAETEEPVEEGQKPYVSMYRGDDGKMIYDVLDKNGESAYKSSDEKVATAYLRKNFDKLSGTAMDDVNENPEANQEMSMDYEYTGDDGETAMGTLFYKVVNGKVDPNSLRGESEYEGNAKVDDEFATDMVKPGGSDHEDALQAAQDDYEYESQRMQSKFGEGNEFAQAVNKAKAAGMKAGDKFKVGDKEYTLKDAIEQAGLQLEEFFSEEELAVENEISRIKNLANYQ